MKGNVQNYFPGGNTSKGFFSYYEHILGQREAESIVCIKGGPGTGKSSFMKRIGEYFLNKGEDIQYFWCSSDPDSLDAVVLKERRVAFLDGTAPHIVDPVNPGAVDTIVHLGEYWNGAALKKYKAYIMQSNTVIKQWFNCAYNNLKAADALRKTLKSIYHDAMVPGELYKITADIVNKEFSHKPVTLSEGQCRKFFATAITSKGHINHMPSLVRHYKKLYFFTAPIGFETEKVLKIISENAVHRGFSVEEYYCPMDPERKIEHLLIPELEMGFLTLNNYHDLELWECSAAVQNVEMREFIDWNTVEKYKETISNCEDASDKLIQQAVVYLKNAKHEHDILENYYIPNMKFEKIENLIDEWIAKIEQNKV